MKRNWLLVEMDQEDLLTYIPSQRVRNTLGDIAVSAALQFSQDKKDENIRTRSRMEAKKEQAAGWVDTMFWSLRYCIETGRELPPNEVVATVMMKQHLSNNLDGGTSGQPENCSPTDVIIRLAERLVDAAKLSVSEERNLEN